MVLEDEFDSSDAYWNAFDQTRQQGSETKSTLDLLLSFTQVINRRTVMLFNYSYSQASGYLTDPFKLISVVNSDGITQENLYEVRPDKRLRHSLFWQTKHALDSGVADVSYRYSNDDWGVDSHTIESRFRYNLTDHSYLQPHVRYYLQSAADFYQPFFLEGETLPQYASADYPIGDMTT